VAPMAHLQSPYDPDDRRALPFSAEGLSVVAAPGKPAPAWVVIASNGALRSNGDAVVTGLRVLRHGDEIQYPAFGTLILWDERVARVEPLPALDKAVRCARCTGDLEPGTLAVKCPSCGRWCHEDGEFTCWSTAATCPVCGQSTTLAGDLAASPEER
jgi:hypothetical protein